MRQQKKQAEEDTVRFTKLQVQLEKVRNEICQFFIELPDHTFERLFEGVEVFRQLTAVQKHEAAAELFHFLETLKPKSLPERPHHD